MQIFAIDGILDICLQDWASRCMVSRLERLTAIQSMTLTDDILLSKLFRSKMLLHMARGVFFREKKNARTLKQKFADRQSVAGGGCSEALRKVPEWTKFNKAGLLKCKLALSLDAKAVLKTRGEQSA